MKRGKVARDGFGRVFEMVRGRMRRGYDWMGVRTRDTPMQKLTRVKLKSFLTSGPLNFLSISSRTKPPFAARNLRPHSASFCPRSWWTKAGTNFSMPQVKILYLNAQSPNIPSTNSSFKFYPFESSWNSKNTGFPHRKRWNKWPTLTWDIKTWCRFFCSPRASF
jgi:hypothetical protein